jgi:uncharacterized protein YxjI
MSGMRYSVREKIFSIGDDFWVTDEQGNQVFLVDGKALSIRHTFELKDRSGTVLAKIHQRLVSIHDTMDIERDGQVIDKEFEIRDGGMVLAQISRAWFRIRDTYGVDVAPGQDDALMIAIAVVLDRIHHDEQEARDR